MHDVDQRPGGETEQQQQDQRRDAQLGSQHLRPHGEDDGQAQPEQNLVRP
jgi:hypothetical protein